MNEALPLLLSLLALPLAPPEHRGAGLSSTDGIVNRAQIHVRYAFPTNPFVAQNYMAHYVYHKFARGRFTHQFDIVKNPLIVQFSYSEDRRDFWLVWFTPGHSPPTFYIDPK